jgi:hypothetical protein
MAAISRRVFLLFGGRDELARPVVFVLYFPVIFVRACRRQVLTQLY